MTESTTRPRRFLDLIPEFERRQTSQLFHRAVRRVGDGERGLRLAIAWTDADIITEPDAADRLERLLDVIESEPELALDYARDVARQHGVGA